MLGQAMMVVGLIIMPVLGHDLTPET